MTYRVNRYVHRGRWYWRVFRGAHVIARCAYAYNSEQMLEADLLALFPQWMAPR